MILVAIIALSAVVLVALYAALVGFPSMPAGVIDGVNTVATYFGQGVGWFYNFVYADVVKAMFAAVVVVEGILLAYKFVMWAVKKVPLFGVSD